ncbi:DUF5641 domain-containing protein [Trichonephila clavipes]|nr:DUF5641 domain-containing protein [Trichonephila clavipes]
MCTVLCDCESLINSRPLTYVTDDVEDLEPLTPTMFLQDIREVGVPESIERDKKERGQLRETLSEGDIVLVGDDHIKILNWNLDANEGSHLPITIDPELSKPQWAATSSMQPCSSVSDGGAGLEPRAETSGHQQAETSLMQPCSSISNGGAGLEPRDETRDFSVKDEPRLGKSSRVSDNVLHKIIRTNPTLISIEVNFKLGINAWANWARFQCLRVGGRLVSLSTRHQWLLISDK